METSTKERIIEHAAWQFLNNGIKNITMDELAEQLGMSKRTIYELFQNKEELIMESLKHFVQKNNSKQKEIYKSADNAFVALLSLYNSNKEGFLRVNHRFIDDLKKYFPKISKMHEDSKEKNSEFLTKIFDDAQKDGFILKTLNPAILSHLFAEQMAIVFEKSSKFQFMDLYETMCVTFFRGIATEKGLEAIKKYIEENKQEK
ncbi:MAG: TetR/AcrR family transcriptional regulator [Paludibacteraceae bacterium]|nr:TetR/AcrR family transcriptional regulator [Paludibacteraceae bacterium]